MPELPEVETIRRGVAPHVEGRVLRELRIDDARWCEPLAAAELAAALEGRRLEALDRRGKYLIWRFEDEAHLLVHLRMTGTLLIDPAPGTPYERVRFRFDGPGPELAFCDPRRFGTGELALGGPALDAFLDARLGFEPFGPEFTGEALYALTRGRRAPIKAFLLDQRRIAGVGNIYADEALFRARIHPLRPAGAITHAQASALRDAVVAVLEAGLGAGGATIDDFRHPDGVQGAFQNDFQVHLRRGEPCVACGAEVVKLVAAGRGTYVCQTCQPPPRGARVRAPRRAAAVSAPRRAA
ncbi:MAG TPA: bifunctional DNA-formamidopyrimidine glycosylase/DNA-(apurinic or apyrimidinic site) lyase [Capillimicrobium sp.]|nr:bifunctional DNA-formamidopyrimidine glycosylase/DNA-(apurinic or apyrimidinic site) lyase [Capillimicrobium sp.]